jgi:hypothetical protein
MRITPLLAAALLALAIAGPARADAPNLEGKDPAAVKALAIEWHAQAESLSETVKAQAREIAELKKKVAATEKELAEVKAATGVKTAPATADRPTPEQIKAAVKEYRQLEADYTKERIQRFKKNNYTPSPEELTTRFPFASSSKTDPGTGLTLPESQQVGKMKVGRARWVSQIVLNKSLGLKLTKTEVGGYKVLITGVAFPGQSEGDNVAVDRLMVCVGQDSTTVPGETLWVLEPAEPDAPGKPAAKR